MSLDHRNKMGIPASDARAYIFVHVNPRIVETGPISHRSVEEFLQSTAAAPPEQENAFFGHPNVFLVPLEGDTDQIVSQVETWLRGERWSQEEIQKIKIEFVGPVHENFTTGGGGYDVETALNYLREIFQDETVRKFLHSPPITAAQVIFDHE